MLPVAISPCPNDTYLFYPWICGKVGKNLPVQVSFADIQQLNQLAKETAFPLIKLSFACFKQVMQHYQLLPVGAALGFNCGPKIIAKHPFSIEEISDKIVAIPGEDTTAHLLFNHLVGKPKSKLFCLYHDIYPKLHSNEADCGLIIHESRFTYIEEGFFEIADLGELWHKTYHLPLPLGGLAIKRDSPHKRKVVEILQNSIKHANFHEASSFILKHSQEQELDVVEKHIHTYVNKETASLSQQGIQAIETLLDCSKSDDWLFSF